MLCQNGGRSAKLNNKLWKNRDPFATGDAPKTGGAIFHPLF